MQRMNRRLLLCTAACVLISGCAGTQDDFGFARQPQLKPGASAKASKRQEKASDPPRILPETHYAAARVFEQQGSPEKAIDQYRKAVTVNHNYTAAYARLGLMLSVTGQHEEAIEAFTKAVELKPSSAILHNNLGFEYLYVERWDDAETHLRQASKIDPKLPQAHINLGLLLGRTERYELALESFRRVLPEPDANYNLGLLHRAQGRFALATECFERVLTINPEFVAARKQLTEIDGKVVKTTTVPTTTPEVLATRQPTSPTLTPTFVTSDVQQPAVPTETGPTRIVDLQNLIDQMITDPVSAPPTHTTQPTRTEPTVHTIQQSIEVTTPTATTRTTEHNTLVVGMETIKPIEYFEEPKVQQFEKVTPTISAEPVVTAPVVERTELTLKEIARAQNFAEQSGTGIIPVQTIVPTSAAFQPHDTIPTPQSVQNDEIILVLAESETRDQPELVIDPVRPVAAAEPVNKSAHILDDMEVSLQVLRNEVHCMKGDEGTEVAFNTTGTEITNITPVDQETIPVAQTSPWVDDVPVAGPIDGSMKTTPDADSNVARVPVTAVYEEPNTKVTAPAFGSTPPSTRASGKTSSKSKERSRNRD